MLKISAKNKRMLSAVMLWFGVIALIAMIVRVVRTKPQGVQGFFNELQGELKNIFSFGGKALLWLVFFTLAFVSFAAGEYQYAVLLTALTTGSGVVTTVNTTYLPKAFYYAAATQLSRITITVQGDGVVFDSDAAGLTHIGTNRLFGQVTNGFYFRVANSFIPNKNVIWEFTNSAAQTPQVFVSSDETDVATPMYLQTLRQAILANSGINFVDFATLSLPSLSATDVVNVLYQDGTQQQLNRADLQFTAGLFQNIVNTPVYIIDNYAGRIKMVNVIAGAAQTAYVQRWVPVVSGAMINQAINNP